MAGSAGSTEQWSSRAGFLLAAVGFAVGLGNIWRFPYITGQNGGSAFLIIYLACALGIGLPLLISEFTIGRRGRSSPSGSIRAVAAESGSSARWGAFGTLAVFSVFIVLSYYTVLSGWTFDYFWRAASGTFEGVDADESSAMFSGLMNNPGRLLFWNTIVNLTVVLIVRRGVQAGIEKAVKILMPALFVALGVMVIYGAIAGDMAATLKFMLEPDFSKVTPGTVMDAIGQAFFSIGIGLAALITFGSYLPKEISIPQSATIVILADTAVALLAGFAIFPLVFAFGLEPSEGAGLIFKTLPLAFGQMPGGQLFGSIFFILLIAAALSSCIGCAEAVVSWIDEKWGIKREKGVLLTAGAGWAVGLLTIMSLGDWSEYYPLDFISAFAGKTIFDSLDFLAANILLLIGGLLVPVFIGWFVPKHIKLEEIGVRDGPFFAIWRFTIRFVIPPVLLIVLVMGILKESKPDELPEASAEVLQSRIAIDDRDVCAFERHAKIRYVSITERGIVTADFIEHCRPGDLATLSGGGFRQVFTVQPNDVFIQHDQLAAASLRCNLNLAGSLQVVHEQPGSCDRRGGDQRAVIA